MKNFTTEARSFTEEEAEIILVLRELRGYLFLY
jgi:hypothetical protein